MAKAHLRPFFTALTPCKFSSPAENATVKPHLGFIIACILFLSSANINSPPSKSSFK
ncbi:hypothetical protein X975_07150, partial [Stegodyphus mimosarum]